MAEGGFSIRPSIGGHRLLGETVRGKKEEQGDSPLSDGRSDRRLRADPRRSIDALLEAAKAVFFASGVDAPVREIAEKAGVGIGTLYRHFPQRSDLIVGVFRREVDACADAAGALAAEHEPGGWSTCSSTGYGATAR